MSENFYRGLKFALPISLIMWALFVWLMLAMLGGCSGGGGGSSPAPTAAAAQLPATAARVVLIGDSITAHWDAPSWQIPTDPLVTMEPAILLSTLLPGSADVAISGQTTGQMLARFQVDVLDRRPTIVVILGGTNDMYSDPSPSIDDISTMAESAAAAGACVIIGTVPPTNNWLAMHYSGETGNAAINAWNSDLVRLAQVYGYTVADYYNALILPSGEENKADFYVDYVHPTALGYQAMWSVLQPALAHCEGK